MRHNAWESDNNDDYSLIIAPYENQPELNKESEPWNECKSACAIVKYALY